jgi:hypothetical protein
MNEPLLSRRSFVQRSLATVSAAVALPNLIAQRASGAGTRPPRPVRLIHQTDLFRPYNDPDDHFDLACVYALAERGAIDLAGILCDSPPPWLKGDPDVTSAAMLSHLTGMATPFVVGMPQPNLSSR